MISPFKFKFDRLNINLILFYQFEVQTILKNLNSVPHLPINTV
jgi:hypothetical protein